MIDLGLSIALGFFVLVLAVWGALVSAEALPPENNKSRHRWGLIAVGILSVVLTIIIGVRGYYAQKESAREKQELSQSLKKNSEELRQVNDTLLQSRMAEEYMQGQLSGLVLVAGRNQGGPNNRSTADLVDAIKRVIKEAPLLQAPTTLSPPANSSIKTTPASPPNTSNAYQEVKSVSESLQAMTSEWNRQVSLIDQEFISTYRHGDGSGQPMAGAMPPDLAERLARSEQGMVGYYDGMRQQIIKAHRDAVAGMALTPSEVAADSQVFEQADATATRLVLATRLTNGRVNRHRFEPMRTYISALLSKLGDYR